MDALSLMYVAFGGAFGSLIRFVCGDIVARYNTSNFPYATFGVNITGSLLMGVWIAVAALMLPAKAKDLHMLFAVGALGGFTTFSTFALESFLILERGDYMQAAIYIVGSVVLSVLGLMAGMFVVRVIAG